MLKLVSESGIRGEQEYYSTIRDAVRVIIIRPGVHWIRLTGGISSKDLIYLIIRITDTKPLWTSAWHDRVARQIERRTSSNEQDEIT